MSSMDSARVFKKNVYKLIYSFFTPVALAFLALGSGGAKGLAAEEKPAAKPPTKKTTTMTPPVKTPPPSKPRPASRKRSCQDLITLNPGPLAAPLDA